jgi:hypothetical protein
MGKLVSGQCALCLQQKQLKRAIFSDVDCTY